MREGDQCRARCPSLLTRALNAAAHEIIRNDPSLGEDQRWELLELVVWPTPALEETPARAASELLADRVLELAASGLNSYEMARQLGRPRSTVAEALRRGCALVDDQAA